MPYIILLLLVCSTYPFVFCQFLPLPSITLIGSGGFLLLSILILYKRRIVGFPYCFNIVFFIQQLTWAFYSVYHSDSSYVTRMVFLIVAYLALLLVYNHSSKGIWNFLNVYRWLILSFAVGGTVCFFLVLFDIIIPLFEYSNVDGRVAYCYGLTCSNFVMGNIMRYSGYFDEPGAMAYWGIFALLFNRLFVGNNKYEKILMTCLAFTLSMAYYIQLCFFVLFVKNKLKAFITLGVLFVVVIWGVTQTKDTEFDIYHYTVNRFEINERTGEIAGDNRSDLAQLAKEQFLMFPILGVGAKNMEQIGYMADNPYEILAKDGLIGEIVTYLPLLLIVLCGIKRRNLYYVYAALILFIGYQQRPFHVDLIHPIMLYLFTILVIEDRKQLSNESCSLDCNSSVQC